MANAAFDWLKSLMQRRGPSHAERLAARQMVADTNLPGALLDKVGEGERAVLDFVGPKMPPAQELGMRASAVPFGAGRKQLEEYGQSDRGRAGLDNTREFFGREPIGKTFDWAMGNEPGTFGTAAMLGLAQEAPIGLASAPVSSGNALMRAVAKPMAQQVAGRGMRAAALRMGKAGVREAPMGAGVGAGMGALQSEPGERMQGALGGAAVGGAGAFIAGAGGQGAQELSRARVTRAFEDARRAANEAGIDVAAPGLTPERAAELEGRQWEAGGDFVNWWDKHGGGQPPMGGKEAIPDVADYFAAGTVEPPMSVPATRALLNSYRAQTSHTGIPKWMRDAEAAAAKPEDIGWADLNEPKPPEPPIPEPPSKADSPRALAKARAAALGMEKTIPTDVRTKPGLGDEVSDEWPTTGVGDPNNEHERFIKEWYARHPHPLSEQSGPTDKMLTDNLNLMLEEGDRPVFPGLDQKGVGELWGIVNDPLVKLRNKYTSRPIQERRAAYLQDIADKVGLDPQETTGHNLGELADNLRLHEGPFANRLKITRRGLERFIRGLRRR